MEKNMFPDPLVKKELDRFVLAELFTDRETDAHKAEDEKNAERQSTQFGSAALPLYAIISPDEKTLALFPSLTRDKQEFIDFLQKGANNFERLTARRGGSGEWGMGSLNAISQIDPLCPIPHSPFPIPHSPLPTPQAPA